MGKAIDFVLPKRAAPMGANLCQRRATLAREKSGPEKKNGLLIGTYMKTIFTKLSRLTAGIAAAGLLASMAATAADAPAAPDKGAPATGDRPPARSFQGRGGMGVTLDDNQRELYRDAMQKNSEQMQKLSDQFRAAQKELVTAAIAEKYDEATVKSKAEAVAKIQTEMTLLRTKAFSSVAPTLKPEQREQLANSPMGAAMLLGGGGGGGFRAMGGGPGGPGGPGGGGGPRRGGGGAGGGAGPGGGQ